jgi:CubicO group peptidase (beta-lactamase class C family)
MNGHAGFGASAPQLGIALARWVASGWPQRMAVDTAEGELGARWGLGLQVAFGGSGRFGQLLSEIPPGFGVLVLEDATTEAPASAPELAGDSGPASDWWFHLGYTGPALFYRPSDRSCIALLMHRRGPEGALLDAEALRARRWAILSAFVGQSR